MFGLSFWEISLILVVALLVLGPKRLPGLAKTAGKGLRELRRASHDLRSAIEEPLQEIRKPLDEIRGELVETVHGFEQEVQREADQKDADTRADSPAIAPPPPTEDPTAADEGQATIQQRQERVEAFYAGQLAQHAQNASPNEPPSESPNSSPDSSPGEFPGQPPKEPPGDL